MRKLELLSAIQDVLGGKYTLQKIKAQEFGNFRMFKNSRKSATKYQLIRYGVRGDRNAVVHTFDSMKSVTLNDLDIIKNDAHNYMVALEEADKTSFNWDYENIYVENPNEEIANWYDRFEDSEDGVPKNHPDLSWYFCSIYDVAFRKMLDN